MCCRCLLNVLETLSFVVVCECVCLFDCFLLLFSGDVVFDVFVMLLLFVFVILSSLGVVCWLLLCYCF